MEKDKSLLPLSHEIFALITLFESFPCNFRSNYLLHISPPTHLVQVGKNLQMIIIIVEYVLTYHFLAGQLTSNDLRDPCILLLLNS